MSSKFVSLIIPTCNMADYIPTLWESLKKSKTLDALFEVVFVNDGSADNTVHVVESLQNISAKVRLVDLKTNQGRFIARFRGAEAAAGTHLLFLDTRVSLTENFGQNLTELLKTYDAIQGVVHIDTKKSVYNLYWQRTHERIFSRHYKAAQSGFYLTAENYESYLKGTTVFLCRRSDFLNACEKYRDRPLHSDDTFLMKEIVQKAPIWVDNRLAIEWEPRQGYWSFLQRLWERGPKFAEYHVFERQGLYFGLFLLWTFAVSVSISLLVVEPFYGLKIIAAELGFLAISTSLFAKNPLEFIKMIPVHVGALLAYGFGAIYGVGVNLRLFKKPAPTGARRL